MKRPTRDEIIQAIQDGVDDYQMSHPTPRFNGDYIADKIEKLFDEDETPEWEKRFSEKFKGIGFVGPNCKGPFEQPFKVKYQEVPIRYFIRDLLKEVRNKVVERRQYATGMRRTMDICDIEDVFKKYGVKID